MPSGCQIVMDRQAQTLVLENIRSQIGNRWKQMVAELRTYGDHDLASFLDESGLELADIVTTEIGCSQEEQPVAGEPLST